MALLDEVPIRLDNDFLAQFDEEISGGQVVTGAASSGARVREARPEELVDDEEPIFDDNDLPTESFGDFRADILRAAVERGIVAGDNPRIALSPEPVRLFLSVPVESTVSLDFFSYLTPELRRELRDERAAEFMAQYALLTPLLESRGATIVHESTIVPLLTVDVPPERLVDVLDAYGWTSASAFVEVESEWTAYTGRDIELALENAAFYDNDYTGGAMNGTAGGNLAPIRVGVVDTFEFNAEHNGWNRPDGSGGWTTRLIGAWDCQSGTCTSYDPVDNGALIPDTDPPIYQPHHGTAVAWVLAGSVMDGQTGQSGLTTRQRRSGVARDVDLYYYSWPSESGTGFAEIVDHAVEQNISVLNMSFFMLCNGCVRGNICNCDRSKNCAGVNEALQYAAANNIVVVKSAGNEGNALPANQCSLTYPAQRPETIAAAALNSVYNGSSPASYADMELANFSSSGPVLVSQLNGAGNYQWSGVDLSAPGRIGKSFGFTGPSSFHHYNASTARPDGRAGTSFAAPQVAGQAALQHQVFRAQASSVANSHWSRVAALLLSGDGTNVNGNALAPIGFVRNFGAGRLRAWARNYTPTPYAWAFRTRTLGNAQTVEVDIQSLNPMSSSYQSVSVVAVRTEPDLNNVARLRLAVHDVCPPGGGEVLLRQSALSAELRQRIELRDSEITGRCLQARVTALGNWGSEERTVRIATRVESRAPWF